MNETSVSVIIPTYNRAHILGEALESVLLQDHAKLQVLVVDDGSRDHTRALVAQFGERVTYLYQENAGPAAARNLALTHAQGSLICFLDSDDLWLPGKLAADLALLEAFPQAEVVFSDCEKWFEGNLVASSWFAAHGMQPVPQEAGIFSNHPKGGWLQAKVFATCCLTFKRSILPRLGVLFDTSLDMYEDWDLALRLHHRCCIAVLPRVVAQVRRFVDGTRVGRGTPGATRSPETCQLMDQRRVGILERACSWEGWSPDVLNAIALELSLLKSRITVRSQELVKS